jgi:hypothetical protein
MDRYLVPNPISRDDMRLNCDGSLTTSSIRLRGSDKEGDWLTAPKGGMR